MKGSNWTEDAKKRAALESVTLVADGHVVGLGTGSTAMYMVDELGRRVREEGLRILGVPTSSRTFCRAKENGIPLTTLDEHPKPDIAIDGADQVDPELNLIKGFGGALTKEKIVDTAAKDLIIIVDERKLVDKLGLDQAIPVEIIPMARTPVMEKLMKLGGRPAVRLNKNNGGYYITENGNYIIDVAFGVIDDAQRLEMNINLIPGVVENGLFIGLTKTVFVGYRSRVERFEKK